MAAMRIGGLASGMDIDTLVEKLMVAERAPLDKLEQKKQTYEWQRDAYREVNTKLQTLDTYIADNLILKSLISKTATSSNSEYVTATASSSASGTLSIEGVSQLATAARSIGDQVNAVSTTTLKELFQNSGVSLPDSYNIAIRSIQKDGTLAKEATKIEFTENTTVSEFVSKINSSGAGVSAVFENGKLSITAMNTGDVQGDAEIKVDSGIEVFKAFKIVKNVDNPNNLASNGKNAIFQVNGIATERSTNTFSISGYSVTLKKTFNAENTFNEKLQAAINEFSYATDNKNQKLDIRNQARDAYFEDDEDITKKISEKHDDAYKLAFGNTLNLSEQEIYKKFGSSFFAISENENLTNIVKNIFADGSKNIEVIRQEINDDSNIPDSLKEELLKLSKEELQTFSSDFKKFNATANYEIFKGVTADQITAFKDLTIDNDMSEEEIKTAINDNDTILQKEALLKLSKEQLIQLYNMTETEITDFQQKADADKLKSIYNSFDSSFFKDLFIGLDETEINELIGLDLSVENPFEGKTQNVIAKLENLSPSQLKQLDNLMKLTGLNYKDQLEKFQSLAENDAARSNWQQAETAYNAAETRLEIAQAKLDVAQKDYQDIIDNGDISSQINPVTMVSTTNVDEIVTKIKDFVNTYNTLVKELNNLTKETKYRDFQPLTSLQRKEMEENEIKLWEEKAKSGLLRGDSIIQNGLSSMRSLIYESNPAVVNTKYNTLFSIGITSSSNYLEGGTLEIDENKLRKALEEDPDAVATLFNNSNGKEKDTIIVNGVSKEADTRGYLKKLRASFDKIQAKIEERAGRSTMNDTQFTLGKYLKDINNRIDSWQKKLVDIESRYWKQFSAMETMINKANQQSTSLSSYFV
ncbi:flagellar filament capping protein FliD [Ureibacillus endophyticus]|uniref:Flagellar hook-associated protein 2 n=1 Tax=Ureibacillus endophyticus TaxID=1978490 RepID=A0A494YSC8_9BACL|nr:flagellar filament capping protein FliD [Lysinibacillus endophyticus]RKQ12842.1 flagellar hook protein [Lysinibacillus endophyticus]